MANNMTIDELAGMIKGEFDSAGHRFDKIDGEIKDIKSEMAEGFKELRNGQENIELKVSNVAYRFELVELQKRVEFLEKKVLNN